MKLIPVVAFLLAAAINPFKGESHDLMIEVLHPAVITAHSVIAVMSKQLYPQYFPPFVQFNSISDTLQPYIHLQHPGTGNGLS